MGLDIDETLCAANMVRILDKAKALGGFVRLDMEGSDYTQRTLDFFRQRLFEPYGAHCGVVIQSMLRRSEQDIEDLIAHAGPGAALQGRLPRAAVGRLPRQGRRGPQLRQADAAAARGRELPGPRHPRRGDHRARRASSPGGSGSATSRFEFQMLYGVRRDLQVRLRRAGHNMRVYIPFGTQWYPYLMRRLAERPANIAFLLGNMVQESLPGR